MPPLRLQRIGEYDTCPKCGSAINETQSITTIAHAEQTSRNDYPPSPEVKVNVNISSDTGKHCS